MSKINKLLHPILFSDPMIKAVHSGRKTQTRRIIKFQPPDDTDTTVYKFATNVTGPSSKNFNKHHWLGFDRNDEIKVNDPNQPYFRCPYGNVGDILWVRETFSRIPKTAYWHDLSIPHTESTDDYSWYIYRAGWNRSKSGICWKPSIHMPYEACRIWLEITNIRVERLQDISEQDAWAEGCKRGEPADNGGYFPADEPDPRGRGELGWDCARDWYADLWELIHGENSWDANPWVWVIEFKITEKPEVK
ncbi:hypothetical protein [Arsenicibacter rosenii]|uniref:Morphogenetic protein n=1 Tax=Arsenicibacter rosenii TaxID=1750698 RepID=A0A1S2VA88_9BACT|nr:hypothetical protein [Arsenicibacter rosenii]OIN55633.1 hypothetical protein BLX24_29045 [Arsenicibacter rosenii]